MGKAKHLQDAGRKGGVARAVNLTPEQRSGIARKAARARWDLRGIIDQGVLPAVRFNIGLKVDHPRPESIVRRKGAVLPQAKAIDEFYRLRAEQVGERAADATILRCEGRFEGARQRGLTCEVAFLPTPREESRAAFHGNMLDLAEKLCGRLGQDEVWFWEGRRLFRATAPGEPAPAPKGPRGKVIR